MYVEIASLAVLVWYTVWSKPHYCRSFELGCSLPQRDGETDGQTSGQSGVYPLPDLAELI